MTAEKKLPLFDRIFKPEHIVLENGHSIDRPKSRMPLILLVLAIAIVISAKTTGFDFEILLRRANQLVVILGRIFRPNFSFFPKVISPLIGTIKMSIVGTVVGCVVSLPFAIFASSNINRNKPLLFVVRIIVSIVRSLPVVVYAYLFVFIFGMGTFAGSLAIGVFTFGIVTKMLYENIETIDMGPYEAMQSFGATTLQSFWAACVPQILPQYLDNCLYCFELNVRQSSILGYVGAGGLGILITERISLRAYEDAGMIFLTIFAVVWTIDLMNDFIRSKIK
ncbi:MAG: phosphonate ABC transporter, permease protein PhnE [Lachnospiraceae bacterium]|nr:phosphonate ABC transporter, permease protein PhnE [Lachnospiraceae bacterium]